MPRAVDSLGSAIPPNIKDILITMGEMPAKLPAERKTDEEAQEAKQDHRDSEGLYLELPDGTRVDRTWVNEKKPALHSRGPRKGKTWRVRFGR